MVFITLKVIKNNPIISIILDLGSQYLAHGNFVITFKLVKINPTEVIGFEGSQSLADITEGIPICQKYAKVEKDCQVPYIVSEKWVTLTCNL